MPNYHRVAKRYARQYGIPPNLFLSLISHESGWNPNAVSPAGAVGFGQLMPGTASGLGVNPNNPRQNLKGSAEYLSDQFHRFGNWRLALAAYNAGPGAVESGDWRNYDETTNYVKNVLAGAGSIRGGSGSPRALGGRTARSGGMPDATAMALQSLSAIAAGEKFSPLEQLSALTQSVDPGGTLKPPRGAKGQPPGTLGRGSSSQILRFANKQVGQPYVWGGESRKEGGFDCSGLIYAAYQRAGISIPRTTYEQIKVGKKVKWGRFRPGDLIFVNGGSHVVMYAGGGKVIAAPHTGDVVHYQPLSLFKSSFYGARRYL